MTTQERHEAILARDAQERAAEGGLRQWTHSEVVGMEVGWSYPSNFPPRGPLDGQPAKDWHCIMYYSDGTRTTVKSDSPRSVPTLA